VRSRALYYIPVSPPRRFCQVFQKGRCPAKRGNTCSWDGGIESVVKMIKTPLGRGANEERRCRGETPLLQKGIDSGARWDKYLVRSCCIRASLSRGWQQSGDSRCWESVNHQGPGGFSWWLRTAYFPRALSRSVWSHQSGENRLCPALKMTDACRKPSMSTSEPN